MTFFKVGAVALLGILLGIQFRGGKQEYSIYIGIGICLLIFSCTAQYMGQVKEQTEALMGYVSSGSRYFSIMFKVVGITWICEFVSGICKDSGFGAVASQVELFGKIAILFAGMPVFLALIETIAQFAG